MLRDGKGGTPAVDDLVEAMWRRFWRQVDEEPQEVWDCYNLVQWLRWHRGRGDIQESATGWIEWVVERLTTARPAAARALLADRRSNREAFIDEAYANGAGRAHACTKVPQAPPVEQAQHEGARSTLPTRSA